MYSISILHPSRGRSAIAKETAKAWLVNAKNPQEIEYIFSVDKSDPQLPKYQTLAKSLGVYCLKSNNKSAIQAINNAAKVSTANLIIVVSDDFNEPPKHWDDKLLEAIGDKNDICVKTQDGIQKTMLTLPIMDREYYNRFGYVYFGGYSHLFCDTEMTVVAKMLGKYVETDLIIPHNHHTTGKFKKDAISKKNDDTWNQGKKLFYERLKTNFGIENPMVKFEDIQW